MNAPSSAHPDTERQRWQQLLTQAAEDGRWQRLVLSKPRSRQPGDAQALQRVQVRLLSLRGQPCLSFVYSHATRDETHNLPVAEGLARIDALLSSDFRNAHLFSSDSELQLMLSKKDKAHLVIKPLQGGTAAPAENASHDREKQRWLTLDRPFLQALGVTTAQQQVVPAMARKWKQINKFVEVFAHALGESALAQPAAGAAPLRVVDFGAGKAYLSFALHDWLTHQQGRAAQVTAVELRADLVQQGQHTVKDLGLKGMQVQQGDVQNWPVQAMDVMVALHACDTATDHAMALGLKAGAQIILCSPCCHKQLRPQLMSPHPLRPLLQHGIHAEQQAEMLTDSLRALLLQAQGYDTKVFEFITLEHTRKNKMILAVKRPAASAAGDPAAAAAEEQVEALKQFFGVREHCLQTLLQQA